MNTLEHIQKLDLRMLLWCRNSCFYPQLELLARVISKTGDGYMQVIFPLAFYLLFPEAGQSILYLFIFAFIIERALYLVLKNVLKRKRPPDVIPNFRSTIKASDHFSFPSGHTMAAFLLATLTWLIFGMSALPLIIWAIGVGASRVILGVHFPTDIIAGAIIGSYIAILTHSSIVA